MSITYGDLRSWRSAAVTSVSEMLRADIHALEKARDAVETDAVPGGWQGSGRFVAIIRQGILVRGMILRRCGRGGLRHLPPTEL